MTLDSYLLHLGHVPRLSPSGQVPRLSQSRQVPKQSQSGQVPRMTPFCSMTVLAVEQSL